MLAFSVAKERVVEWVLRFNDPQSEHAIIVLLGSPRNRVKCMNVQIDNAWA